MPPSLLYLGYIYTKLLPCVCLRLRQTRPLCKKGFVLGRKLDELRGGRTLQKLGCELPPATSLPMLVAKTTSLQLHGLWFPKIPRGRGTHISLRCRDAQHPLGNWFLRNIHLSLPALTPPLSSGFSNPQPSYQSCFSTKSQGLAGTAIFGDTQYPN